MAAVIGLGSGCGDITTPVTLALEEPSNISLVVAGQPQGTNLTGGVETTIVTHLGWSEFFGALVGQAIPAAVNVDDLLIAGDPILIFGFLSTGTVCLYQNPDLASTGSAQFNLLLGVATFGMTLNSVIAVMNPQVSALMGGPQPFSQTVGPVAVELSLTDLLALMSGSGGNLSLSQAISTDIATPIGVIHAEGTLTLASTDTFPDNLLLQECAAYVAGLP